MVAMAQLVTEHTRALLQGRTDVHSSTMLLVKVEFLKVKIGEAVQFSSLAASEKHSLVTLASLSNYMPHQV